MADDRFYTDPKAMEPLFPDGEIEDMERLAADLISKTARLSGATNQITRKAIADFLRPMNSYYSNLIEGHDTHPIDIERALKNDFSEDKAKRDLQMEAYAHIKLHEEICGEVGTENSKVIPSSTNYLNSIHRRFYEHLPADFKEVKSREGVIKTVVPGAFRADEVEVGRHIGPHSQSLPFLWTGFKNSMTRKLQPISQKSDASFL